MPLKDHAARYANILLPVGSERRRRAKALLGDRGTQTPLTMPTVPDDLRRRHVTFSPEQMQDMEEALRRHYFGSQVDFFGPTETYLATDAGREDLHMHLRGRLENDRATVVPWLNSIRPLDGVRILEVGCGTGTSTVALAEQGATVVGIDVHAGSLRAAQERARIAGIAGRVSFQEANAADLSSFVKPGEYDCILFFASLEHMTLAERLTALADSWDLLEPGGLLVSIETPNRLWYIDDHSSFEPFFYWLPDDLAVRWAARSPRETYRRAFDVQNPDMLEFSRHGRGVSYHDFTIALGIDPQLLPATVSMHEYLSTGRFSRATPDGRYVRTLQRLAPNVPAGFFYPYLDLALRK